MSFTLTAKQTRQINWITDQLQALDPTQGVSVRYAEEGVANQGGSWQIVTITWGRAFQSYSADVAASTANNNAVSVCLVNAKQALLQVTSGVPWVQYVDPSDVPPPPPPPTPPDMIIFGLPQIGPDGRTYRQDLRGDGKQRKMEETPFGWQVVEDWH